MISHEKKFIFIHIPKNGGTSINISLRDYCEYPPELSAGIRNSNLSIEYQKHTALAEIKNSNIDIQKYFKFCIIRNPWDRILSLYFHRIEKVKKLSDTQHSDFNSWIQNVFLNEYLSKKYWKNQIEYISIDGKVNVDYIIRFENYQDGWQQVCQKLKIEKDLVHEYKTNHQKYTQYYNKSSIQAVQKIFKKDIELFKYSFGR